MISDVKSSNTHIYSVKSATTANRKKYRDSYKLFKKVR